MDYDVIVIGAGPGGYEAAARAAGQGLSTLLVEKSHLGGTCLNCGCIPTKAMCRSAQVAADVSHSADFGIIIPEGAVRVDMSRIVERKRAIVGELREAVASLCAGADIVEGEARFTAPHTVEVDGKSYTAPKIIVATGSRAASLAVPGAELAVDASYLLDMETLPESLAVIGGGVIGMEFASIFSAFGVKVSVVEYCKEILPMMDRDVARTVRTALKRRGVEIITEAEVKEITEESSGLRTVIYERKGRPAAVEAQMVLMAVGRCPVVPEGLESCGAAVGRRGIEVDEKFETLLPGVFAIGDCNGRCQLAHAASAQAVAVTGGKIDLSVIPSAVFTVPECAMVGRTEQHLAEEGVDFNVSKATFRSNGKALTMGEPDGVVKIITDPASGLIMGCQIVGAHAADLIAEVSLAMSAGVPARQVAATVHSHPTLGEALLAALRGC